MIGKMKKANIAFKSKNDLDSIEIDKSRINTFISLEEDKSIGLRQINGKVIWIMKLI